MDAITKSSARAYNNSRELFREIKKLFFDLDDSSGAFNKHEIIQDIQYNIDALRSESRKVKINLLSKAYSTKIVKDIEYTMDIFRTQSAIFSKKIMAINYYDDISSNINKYIVGVIPSLSQNEIAKFGSDPKNLKTVFLKKILAPNRIEKFKLKLNQLVQSTMSQKMFNAIFKGLLYDHVISSGEISSAGHLEANQRAEDEYKRFHSLDKYKENIASNDSATKHAAEQAANVKFRKKI